MIGFAALRARFLRDRQDAGATPGVAAALAAIGWNAVGDPTPEELAAYVVELIESCVTDRRDTEWLVSAVAHLLRDCGPLLDGGLPPAAAYEPAARELLERYVRGEVDRPAPPFAGG